MNEVYVVVLVAGLAIIASLYFRRKGYSHNQRIVLSGVAAALLIWSNRVQLAGNPGSWIFIGIAVAILFIGAWNVRRHR